MTPAELTTKLVAGDQLLVRQRVFERLSYITVTGGRQGPVPLGLVADAELVADLVAIPGGSYTSEVVTYAEFEDPAEPTPRVPVYILAAQLESPVQNVATLDDQLATQLAALSSADIVALVQAFQPAPSSSRPGPSGGRPGGTSDRRILDV